MSLIKNFFTIPLSSSESLSIQTATLRIIVTLTIFLNGFNLITLIVTSGSNQRTVIAIVMLCVQGGVLYLLRRQAITMATFIFVTAVWLSFQISVSQNSGIFDPVFSASAFSIIVATLLISEHAGLLFASLTIISGGIWVLAAQIGSIQPPNLGYITAFQAWTNHTVFFIAVYFVIVYSVRTIKHALERAWQGEMELREKNSQYEYELTERQRLLSRLEDSENRWRYALEGSGDGVWDLDILRNTVFRSRRYKELLGIQETDTAFIVDDWASRIHPEDSARVTDCFSRYLAGEIPSYEVEYRLRHQDGTYGWFLSRGQITNCAVDGSPLRVVGTLANVTQRKEMEESLRLSESAYRQMFEDNPNPMWVYDADTTYFLAVNDAAIEHFGYSREEFLGMTIKQIRVPEEHDRLSEFMKQKKVYLKSNNWHYIKKNGDIVDVELAAHELNFRGRRARLVLVVDVTERYRTQRALANSEKLFSQIFQAVPIALSIINRKDNTFIKVNDAFVELTGYDFNELVDKRPTDLYHWHNLKDRELYAQTMGEMGYARGFEGTIVQKNGTRVDVLLFADTIEVDGQPCTLGIAVDISEHKESERRLLEAEKLQLEAQSERELAELKERFISSVSHEFRNPLTVILSTISTLKLHYYSFTYEQQQERFGRVEKHTRYLSALLDDVLTVSQARAGKLTCSRTSFELVAFCREIFDEIQLTDTTTHRFRFAADDQLGIASMDTKLLQHILINLISNAIKYSPTDAEVSLSLLRDGDAVIIKITDQGMGISQEDQKQLFVPFFRSDSARKIKGTGLGLTIVQESVAAHGGTITFESEPGKGTTFTVSLPAHFSVN